MGEDFSSSSENLRTNWTLPMDHCFLELLLEQVNRGNKNGNVFIKEAWTEMIARFNDKFGFKHKTDVLKNRYKWLRKQYSNIKILIQNGFSWDEKQQMVTADNHVWEDYIKAHPDMQTYRAKVVPYYNKLCKICGHAVADGRYSLSSLDVDYENEAKALDDQTLPQSDPAKIDWSREMDEYFIQLMLEQVRKGNKIGRTFKNKAWIDMIVQFNTKFGYQHGKVVLKNRYNILSRQYCTIKYLLSQGGFSWDEKQQMLIADDRVWKKVIKASRNFRRYRNKTMPGYVDMCVICGSETANVRSDISPSGLSFEKKTPAKTSGVFAVPEGCQETSEWGSIKKLTDQQKKRGPDVEVNFHPSNKAQKVDEGIEDAMREIAVAVTILTKKNNDGHCIDTKNVINALQAIPDMDEDLLLDACDFLEDESKARMFLALDQTLRKKWLTRKLRP
ncbi:uncharacterized protein LOC130757641 [Actinidia eriantha]|uniref:uncharacterized protein LOC130757641 n=1 Tax=Actinidia eriantha TaxID=165200 RepID=UPI002585F4D3|nr:uncharacterized protein LOC130757641 [Actinidia eriantha]XP_057468415.1 uncharacterized protein LOC130757641 [Actinidia eriantha]